MRFQPSLALVLGFVAGLATPIARAQIVVVPSAVLTAADRVSPDTTKPGFLWRVHQNSNLQANDNVRPVQQLAGQLAMNLANPSANGVASGPGQVGATDRLPIQFEIPGVINLNQSGGLSFGDFIPDDQMPGIPGRTGGLDGIAAEILTYISLPAGVHTFIVNSDDGFFTTAGNIRDLFAAKLAGEFVGGRGAADTAYRLVVEQAGVYAFRTVWEEGGGDANIEWKTVRADGSRVLLNDGSRGGFPCYRAIVAGTPAAITRVTPTVGATETDPSTAIEAMVEEGDTRVELSSVRLSLDGTDVTPTVGRVGSAVRIAYQPPSPLAIGVRHTASVRFTAGTPRSEVWSFTIPPLTRDQVHRYPGFLRGTAAFSSNAGGRTGQPGDYAMDFGRGGGNQSVHIADATFLNATTGDDEMTFSVWQKLYEVADSSVFWADATSGGSDARGWQAHTPWSDNNVYFDTSGCCDGLLHRVVESIASLDGYTGPDWWRRWHHFAFTRKGTLKSVWVDGRLLIQAENEIRLPNDFTDLFLGAQSPGTQNNLHGLIDDFAIYDKALNIDLVGLLAQGASPTDPRLAASGLLGYWSFDDAASSSSSSPSYSIGLNFGADEVNGARTGALVATNKAGAPAFAQANWNNLSLSGGAVTNLIADAAGRGEPTAMTVSWSAPNTWASTGRGEENNGFTGADRILMTGYLDTGDATTTTVTMQNLPARVTANGYDVCVYLLGGVPNKGGGYRIVDATSGAVLRDYLLAQCSVNPTAHVQAAPNGTTPGTGTYLLIGGLTSPNIRVEATTAGGLGFGAPPRAPINAIQLLARSSNSPISYPISVPAGLGLFGISVRSGDNSLNQLLPKIEHGTTLYAWDPANIAFRTSVYISNLLWVPNQILAPGAGFFLQSAAPGTALISGSPPQEAELRLSRGISLITPPILLSQPTPLERLFASGVPPGTTVYVFNKPEQKYDVIIFDDLTGTWPTPPVLIAPGEAFFIKVDSALVWNQRDGSLRPAGALASPAKSRRDPVTQRIPRGGRGTIRLANVGVGFSTPVGKPPLSDYLAGGDYLADLWVGPDAAQMRQLSPQFTAAEQNSLKLPYSIEVNGWIALSNSLPVPDSLPGAKVTAQIRIWPASKSGYTAAAQDANVLLFESNPVPGIQLGGPEGQESSDGNKTPGTLADLQKYRVRWPIAFTPEPPTELKASSAPVSITVASVAEGTTGPAPELRILANTTPPAQINTTATPGTYRLQPGGSGTLTLEASHSGNTEVVPHSVLRTITVKPADPALIPQTLAFGLPARVAFPGNVTLRATLTPNPNGGQVRFVVASGDAAILSGNPPVLSINRPENITVRAEVPAAGGYSGATNSFTIQVLYASFQPGGIASQGPQNVLLHLQVNPPDAVLVLQSKRRLEEAWADVQSVRAAGSDFRISAPVDGTARFYRIIFP